MFKTCPKCGYQEIPKGYSWNEDHQVMYIDSDKARKTIDNICEMMEIRYPTCALNNGGVEYETDKGPINITENGRYFKWNGKKLTVKEVFDLFVKNKEPDWGSFD